jgi:Flp pilus assembly protein TadD
MIVRDEGERIEKSLGSVHSLCDEVVVIDTGSSDDTKERARQCGASVHVFEWCDDFSAARNFAIDQASGKWIFCLDADEVVAPGDLEVIRDLTLGGETAWSFRTRNYTDDHSRFDWVPVMPEETAVARGFAGWVPSKKVRLFPRKPAIRFEGALHEMVERSIRADLIPIQSATVDIHHHGFEKSGDRLARRKALYSRLAEKKFQTMPDNPIAALEIGIEYLGAGEPDSAVPYLRKAVAGRPGDVEAVLALSGALTRIGLTEEASGVLADAHRDSPDQPELATVYATRLASAGQVGEAITILDRVGNVHRDSWRLQYNRGILHARVGHVPEARRAFTLSVETYPGYLDSYRKLAVLGVVDKDREAIFRWLEAGLAQPGAIRHPEYLKFAAAVFYQQENVERARGVVRLLQEHHPGDPQLQGLSDKILGFA